ncbi:MAG: hypothetical protein HY908_19360 [Myxococcales bacterium]|nr:hypothetical protein [Myxococcales bacterium]
MSSSFALSADLALPYVVAACVLAGLGLALLLLELWRKRDSGVRAGLVAATGVLALAALLVAVLRPVRIHTRGTSAGPAVAVLVDASRSVDLPGDDGRSRREATALALAALGERLAGVRLRVLTFGDGAPKVLEDPRAPRFDAPPERTSDLSAALRAVATSTDEPPNALVVVSDGRLDRPGEDQPGAAARAAAAPLEVPIHTVAVARREPVDAAVRAVRAAGAAVAHQPLRLAVEVACTGGMACGELPITARELHHDGPSLMRASGKARVADGRGVVDLELTLDRAGKRILEIGIDPQPGDQIPGNDRRYLTLDVTRDRVRLLHVAGRPTYDTRALRTWLKSDASVDLVAFFILRTPTDQVNAVGDELALIKFPVDDLFTLHLPSFDAVVLQDFDAEPYGLTRHLPSLASYVKNGGGLIMVGGPNAFVSGHYGRTALASVLPVALDGIAQKDAVDLATFEPVVTPAGRRAPVLGPLRGLLGPGLPPMSGTNVVGDLRPGATALVEHPTRKTPSGKAMPVLALGEYKNGRSIALTVDGAHRLLFSTFAAETSGRAHGAFWDALLGWLMRDPRFEPAVVDLAAPCLAGEEATLRLRSAFGDGAQAKVEVTRMGSGELVRRVDVALPTGDDAAPLPLGKLDAGGYSVKVELADGRAAPSRYDFACEAGGDEWADPRPDPVRLAAIARATGGVALGLDGVDELPLPEAEQVLSERHVRALVPPWLAALVAALLLGGHWIVRRRAGLA